MLGLLLTSTLTLWGSIDVLAGPENPYAAPEPEQIAEQILALPKDIGCAVIETRTDDESRNLNEKITQVLSAFRQGLSRDRFRLSQVKEPNSDGGRIFVIEYRPTINNRRFFSDIFHNLDIKIVERDDPGSTQEVGWLLSVMGFGTALMGTQKITESEQFARLIQKLLPMKNLPAKSAIALPLALFVTTAGVVITKILSNRSRVRAALREQFFDRDGSPFDTAFLVPNRISRRQRRLMNLEPVEFEQRQLKEP